MRWSVCCTTPPFLFTPLPLCLNASAHFPGSPTFLLVFVCACVLYRYFLMLLLRAPLFRTCVPPSFYGQFSDVHNYLFQFGRVLFQRRPLAVVIRVYERFSFSSFLLRSFYLLHIPSFSFLLTSIRFSSFLRC